MSGLGAGFRLDVSPPRGALEISDRNGLMELRKHLGDGHYEVIAVARPDHEAILQCWRSFCWKKGRAPVPSGELAELPEFGGVP
jgi:hypothetical protein